MFLKLKQIMQKNNWPSKRGTSLLPKQKSL